MDTDDGCSATSIAIQHRNHHHDELIGELSAKLACDIIDDATREAASRCLSPPKPEVDPQLLEVPHLSDLESIELEHQDSLEDLNPSHLSLDLETTQTDMDIADPAECSEQDDDFCCEPPSNDTLRQLKLEAMQDMMVCEKSRESLQAARRLFDCLAAGTPTLAQKGVPAGSVASNDEDACSSSAASSSGRSDDSVGMQAITLSKQPSRTLVCSLSPSGETQTNQQQDDDDEMRQCREAFERNKRLILQKLSSADEGKTRPQQQQRALGQGKKRLQTR